MNETEGLAVVAIVVGFYGSVLVICGINGAVSATIVGALCLLGGYIIGKKKATKER